MTDHPILNQTVPSANNSAEILDRGDQIDHPALDPFDPENMRISQDFKPGVEKALLTIPVKKPSKEWFIRVHPTWRVETYVIELKEEREIYYVNPALVPELGCEATLGPRAIFTAVNRQGVVFLWPIRLPGEDGKIDDWNESALQATQMAVDNWIRVTANMSLGAYEIWEATAELPEPKWPNKSFRELLEIAFKKRYINSLDHPVVLRLLGAK